MAELVTNSNLDSGVSYSASEIKIGLGNKLLIDAGAVSTIVIGAWNRLMACASTEIQLGTAAEVTMARAISVTLGESWNYLGNHQTTSKNSFISATRQVLLTAGVSAEQKRLRVNEKRYAKRILLATITSFIFTVGISLITIKFPPFKTTKTPEDTEEIQLNTDGVYLILGEALGMICLLLAQYVLAKKMNEKLNTVNKPVSSLSLAANGISAAVYANPDNQGGMVEKTLYIPKSPYNKKKRKYNFKKIKQTEFLENTSAAATVDIRPGRFSEFDPNILNMSQPNYGEFPLPEENPHIVLNVSTPETEKDNTIVMSPGAVGIMENNNFISLTVDNDNSFTTIKNANAENLGGIIHVNNDSTIIQRNCGDAIEIASCFDITHHYNNVNGKVDYDDDGVEEAAAAIYSNQLILDTPQKPEEDKPQLQSSTINSCLNLSEEKASISIQTNHHGTSGIFINQTYTDIVIEGKILASCTPSQIEINGQLKTTERYTSFGEICIKSKAQKPQLLAIQDNFELRNFYKLLMANLDYFNFFKNQAQSTRMYSRTIEKNSR